MSTLTYHSPHVGDVPVHVVRRTPGRVWLKVDEARGKLYPFGQEFAVSPDHPCLKGGA